MIRSELVFKSPFFILRMKVEVRYKLVLYLKLKLPIKVTKECKESQLSSALLYFSSNYFLDTFPSFLKGWIHCETFLSEYS